MVMPYLSQKHPQGRPFWKDVKAYNDNWRRQEVPTTFGTGFLPVLHVDRRSHRLHTISIRSTSRLEPLSMHTFGVPLVLVCELAIDRDLATRFFDLQPGQTVVPYFDSEQLPADALQLGRHGARQPVQLPADALQLPADALHGTHLELSGAG